MTAQMTLEPEVLEVTPPAAGLVQCSTLADGRLIRLSGTIGAAEHVGLRLSLLNPIPDGCRDIVIDAGEVGDIDDVAVAILVAAREWAELFGARVLLSRSAPALDRVLQELDMTDLLPRLSTRRAPSRGVPAPRSAND